MFDVFARPDLLRPDLEDIQGRLCVLRLDLTAAYDCFPREIRQVLDDLLGIQLPIAATRRPIGLRPSHRRNAVRLYGHYIRLGTSMPSNAMALFMTFATVCANIKRNARFCSSASFKML